mgnify:CR=1 FL=1
MAKRARAGEGEYMSRYFFYDNGDIPARYEETVPQVFPTTAPGKLYMASGNRTLCAYDVLSISVGFELS